MLLDQHPSLISVPSLGNTYCTVAMGLKHGSDVGAIARAASSLLKSRATIGPRIDEVIAATSRGSVITQDWGIRTIAGVAARDPALRDSLLRYLFAFVARCTARDVPKHAASISIAVDGRQRDRFVAVLRARERDLTRAQLSRLRKVYRGLLDPVRSNSPE